MVTEVDEYRRWMRHPIGPRREMPPDWPDGRIQQESGVPSSGRHMHRARPPIRLVSLRQERRLRLKSD